LDKIWILIMALGFEKILDLRLTWVIPHLNWHSGLPSRTNYLAG